MLAKDEKAPVLRIRVSEDALAVLVDGVIEGELDALAAELERELARLQVAGPPSREALVNWLKERREKGGGSVDGEVLLQGVAAVAPVDGAIVWAGNFFESGFAIDESTGAIDYRTQTAQRSVKPDQLLATVTQPVAGRDGQDVFGRRIKSGQARAALLRVGVNVKSPSPGTYCSAVEGRLRWVDHTLSVDPVYVVEGDVGLETGNIDHPGAVEVKGDVQEDARVVAKGDVDVLQMVEHADIETGGSLSVRGGIAGGGHMVVVAGSVHARYILDAKVESGQDIVVEREVFHSNLKTQGSVIMPKGRIIGGEVTALCGIRVDQLSSSAAVPTTVVVGDDYRLPGFLAAREERVSLLNQELSDIEAQLGHSRSKLEALTAAGKAKLERLLNRSEAIRREVSGLNAEMDAARKESASRAVFCVEVRGAVYPESVICMGGERLRVQKEIRGPVRICLRNGRIQILDGSGC